MKTLTLFFVCTLFLFSCQTKPQQYFSSCPEIDMIRNGNAAYVAGDWKALRAIYADTAKILNNTWMNDATAPDEFVAQLQGVVGNYSEYGIGGDAVYEMIVTDKGEKWVHNWLLWKGKHKNGTEVQFPIHLSFRIAEGKVVTQVNMYDRLPAYLASHPVTVADAATPK